MLSIRTLGGWLVPLLLTLGCAGSHAAPLAPLAPFTPPRADPARRAKLVSLTPKLDAHFAAKLKETRATGFAVGILLDGELVYEHGFGVRDIASRAPVDGDTVFRIASITKSFTALAALKLRDEGRLSLDAPVATYAPELAALTPPTRDSAPVSLRLLLSNASGLAYDDLWGAVSFGKSEEQLATLLRNGVQFSTAPGSRYAYSNLGWALAGRVVERVSGARYRDYVTDNLLRPLGMNSTVWEASDVPAGRLAIGYYRDGDKLVEESRPSDGVFAAAGGLYSSLHDYARYASLHLAAYPPRDDLETGPVRRSTLREMHEGQRWARMDTDAPVVRTSDDGVNLTAPSYGLGWLNVTSCTEEGRVQHGGMEPGYFAWVVLMPAARIGYVALATTEHVGRIARPGAFDILREAGLLTPLAPRPHAVLANMPAVLAKLVETRDPDLFTRTFDPDSAKYSWNRTLKDDLVRIAREHGRCSPDGKLDVHGAHHGSFRMKCERGAVRFEVLLSPATPPQVQSVNITEELSADERTDRAARAIAAAIRDSVEDASGELFAPSVDLARMKKTLRRLAIAHGACSVEHGFIETFQAPLEMERSPHYVLRCGDGPLDLTFNLDEKTGKVMAFDAHPPYALEGTCW